MLKKIGGLIFFALVIFLIIYFHSIEKAVVTEEESLVVNQGETVDDIAEKLHEQDILENYNFFIFYIRSNNLSKQIKAGKYYLQPGFSIKDISQLLVSDKAKKPEVTIKITEGWNINKIASHLEEKGFFSKEEWYQEVGYPKNRDKNKDLNLEEKYVQEYEFLESKPKHYSLEGYLFPDTYRLYQDFTPQDLAEKMLSNFSNKLDGELIRKIEKSDRSLHELVTMASLLEKEVGDTNNSKEIKIISGIFWNRLKNGQALESCASLAYILEENKRQYSDQDTKIESPYNTYKYQGLPPAPVSNPGLKAIEAAISPKESDYNYFLSPIGSDKTIFAETYQEHVENKNQYLD